MSGACARSTGSVYHRKLERIDVSRRIGRGREELHFNPSPTDVARRTTAMILGNYIAHLHFPPHVRKAGRQAKQGQVTRHALVRQYPIGIGCR
jgi:hypothetical protein